MHQPATHSTRRTTGLVGAWPLAASIALACAGPGVGATIAQDAVAPNATGPSPGTEFSGPQVGEKVTPFAIRTVLGERAGADVDVVAAAAGKPLVLFFVHEVTRPALGLARIILTYSASRRADGLHAGLILLTADPTASEEWAKRAAGALPRGVPVGISKDGAEGPGAYGLNRKVAVTVLVAKDNKVTANFALVQPSIAADASKIAHAITAALGDAEPPTLEQLEKLIAPVRPAKIR